MSTIRIFNHEMFGDIRTVLSERGETFFVGKDIAEALGYARSRTHSHRDAEGDLHTNTYLVWTEEGRLFIQRINQELKNE